MYDHFFGLPRLKCNKSAVCFRLSKPKLRVPFGFEMPFPDMFDRCPYFRKSTLFKDT